MYFVVSVDVTVDSKPIRLQLCDTAGQVCIYQFFILKVKILFKLSKR